MVTYYVGHRPLIGKASDVRSEEMSQVMHSLCVCMVLDAWSGSFQQLFVHATQSHFRIMEEVCKPDCIDSLLLLA